jgi:hypothetical protein
VPLLAFLRGQTSERKLRLFACACLRHVWPLIGDAFARKAVKVAERVADGELPREKLRYARGSARRAAQVNNRRGGTEPLLWTVASLCEEEGPGWPVGVVNGAAWGLAQPPVSPSSAEARAALMAPLRDVMGNPFRPVVIKQAWLTSSVASLAQAAYDERRLPSGHLDCARLAVLADALEEAGADDAELLAHLRSEGPHVRGCWAVDAVLGRG